jgi:hypothetical protein
MGFLLVLGGVLVAAGSVAGLIVLVAWQRWRGASRGAAEQVARGAWVHEVCPQCRGSGRCPQCGGMGTLGLLGKPCPSCGGGERETPSGPITVQGTGRCTTCLGLGSVYRVVATGRLLPVDRTGL